MTTLLDTRRRMFLYLCAVALLCLLPPAQAKTAGHRKSRTQAKQSGPKTRLGPKAATLSVNRPPEGEGPQVATIYVIRPPVFRSLVCVGVTAKSWRPVPGLHAGKPFPQPLHAGELVRCGPGGKADVLLAVGHVILMPGQRLPIVNVPPADSARLDAAFTALLVTAGNTRDSPVILSPADGDTVWPETLPFEWQPYAAGVSLTLTLHAAPTGSILWQQAGVDGMSGRFRAAAAGDALRHWRDASHGAPVALDVQPDRGKMESVTFSVLSADGERAVTRDLAAWDSTPEGALRHLGRASVFYRDDLYPESAAEYEAALRCEPDSPLLRHRAAEAYRMYRSLARAEALEPTHP